jgi:ribosomal protein L1
MVELKPTGTKGQFLKKVYMASSMGKGIKVDITRAPFAFKLVY